MEPASRQEQWSAPGTVRSWVQYGAGAVVAWARRDSLAAAEQAMALRDGLDGLDRGESRGLYFETATSFVSFLVSRRGAKRFRTYAASFDPAAPDVAAQAAYGVDSEQLEAEWRAAMED